MKKWYRFEIEYQLVNPFSYEVKSKIYTNYQTVYMESVEQAKEHAIKRFELERLGDKMIGIRLIQD